MPFELISDPQMLVGRTITKVHPDFDDKCYLLLDGDLLISIDLDDYSFSEQITVTDFTPTNWPPDLRESVKKSFREFVSKTTQQREVAEALSIFKKYNITEIPKDI